MTCLLLVAAPAAAAELAAAEIPPGADQAAVNGQPAANTQPAANGQPTTNGAPASNAPATPDNQAPAKSLFIAPSLLVSETYTNNANFGNADFAQSDFITELAPSLVLRSVGKHLQVSSNLHLDGLYYARGTQQNKVLPSGGVDATVESLDQHLYVDAGAVALQTPENVFAATPDGPSTYNTLTTTNYRLSPYFRGSLPGGLLYVVRSDNGWVRSTGASTASVDDSRLARQSVEVDSAPVPFGWTVRLESAQTQYPESPYPESRESTGHLILKAAPDPQLVLSARGGAEHENFLIDTKGRPIYGAGLDWRPTDRTDIELLAERRFFGTKWDYGFKHHTERLVLSAVGGRDVVTTAQTVFVIPANSEMGAMLDSVLVAHYPDPIERAAAVQNLLTQQNLPDTIASAMTIFADFPLLETWNKVAITWMGARDSVSLSAYNLRSEPLSPNLTSIIVPASPSYDNDQWQVSLVLTHHLTPFASVTATGRVSEINGLDEFSAARTRQNAGTLQFNLALSARSDAFVGTRLQAIESTVSTPAREKAVQVGLNHRF